MLTQILAFAFFASFLLRVLLFAGRCSWSNPITSGHHMAHAERAVRRPPSDRTLKRNARHSDRKTFQRSVPNESLTDNDPRTHSHNPIPMIIICIPVITNCSIGRSFFSFALPRRTGRSRLHFVRRLHSAPGRRAKSDSLAGFRCCENHFHSPREEEK